MTDNALMFADVKTGDYQSFDSVCSQTMVGFVQTIGGGGSSMTEQKITCFVGQQDKNYDIEATDTQQSQDVRHALISRH